MDCYLGIDIGTFETKGVLVNGRGTVLGTARRRHDLIVPESGWAEHDAEKDWWGDFCAISQELIAATGIAASDIKSVAASGIGPCMLPVDEQGVPLMNAVLYGVDTRASVEIAELTEEIGNEALLEECGNTLSSQSVGPKILWLKKNRPEIFARTYKVMNSSSFLVQRLTGRFVIDHYSAASSSPLYDIRTNGWNRAYADRIIEPERLPDILWSTEIAGYVTEAAARATGLEAGTPVTAGTIDAAAEAVSVGVLGAGEMMIMYGSSMFIILVTDARVSDHRLWYAPWLFKGQHACMAGTSTAGTLTRWFQDHLAQELDQQQAMPQLAHEAETSPAGANGIIILPYFSGERTPLNDPHARGLIFGLDLTHTRADIYRALLEGIAYGVTSIIEAYENAGAEIGRIAAVGGGTKNTVWTQAVSDTSGKVQEVATHTVGAAFGSAFLAAVAVDAAEVGDIRHWNAVDHSITPTESDRAIYQARFRTFKELYARNHDLMRDESRRACDDA